MGSKGCCCCSAHPLALLAGSGNNAGCNGGKTADCNIAREDVAGLIYFYLGKQVFFGISLLRNQASPYLLRFLAYAAISVLIWLEYVKRGGMSSHRNFLYTAGK